MRSRMTRPLLAVAAAALALAALTGAAGAGGAETPSGVNLEGATVASLDELTGSGPIMLRVRGNPSAVAWSDAKAGGASNAAAAAAARSQKAQNENAQRGVLNALSRVPSAQPLYQVQTAYNGVAVQAPFAAMDELARLPGVEQVLRIPLVELDNHYSVPFIGAAQAWEAFGKTGAGLSIAVIDTGVDWVHAGFGGTGTSADLTIARSAAANPLDTSGNQNPGSFTVTGSSGEQIYPSAKVVGGFDFAGDSYTGSGAGATPRPDPNPMDCNGHGTHVAGTAAGTGVNSDGTSYGGPYDSSLDTGAMRVGPGVAPEAPIYALRVFGCSGTTGLTVQAINWALDPNRDGSPDDAVDVINMSLGSGFGTVADPSAVASDNAAQAGVLVVASAGNSGDTYYVTGSPGVATRAISVASSRDAAERADAILVRAPSGAEASYIASRSVQPALWASKPETTGNVYYPATNQYGCDAWTGADLANISGRIVLVDWKKPGDVAFPCGSAVRANNATAAGAIGIIMADNVPFLDTAIGANATTPGMYTTSTTGDALKAHLTAGAISSLEVTLSSLVRGDGLFAGLNDTLSTFSSRGITSSSNALKPDISAPGQTIWSPAVWTGTQGRSLNGTSMAAPHMAGVMALLKQARPGWSVEHLKALAMNTAGHDIYSGFGQTGDRFGVGRVGAGRVDIPAALANDAIAYADDGSGAVGVSFGALEVTGTLTAERSIRVFNHGTTAKTYAVSYDARTSIPGVSFSFPDGSSVAVPADGSATLRVQLTADASVMKHTRDATVATTQISGTTAFPRQWLSEASGLVLLTPLSGQTLRVPVHAAARPASAMRASRSSISFFGDNATSNSISLTGTGVNTGESEPLDLVSRVTALELAATSPALASLPSGFPAFTRYADISHVGVASDARARVGAGQPVANSWIYFGVASHANWTTAASEAVFTVQIDTNNDNVVDYNVFNTRLVAPPNNDPLDVFVGARTQIPAPAPPTPATVATDFTNGRAVPSTALFNTNVLVIPVSAASLGYTAESTSTTFRYRVIGSSRFGTVDTVPSATTWLTYNFASPGLDFTGGTLGIPQYPDQPDQVIPVGYDAAAYTANGSQGALLLHHFNASGQRTEVLTLQTSPGLPPGGGGPPGGRPPRP